jgi:hypothetical protein
MRGEKHPLGNLPDQRAGLNRTHRAPVLMGTRQDAKK